MRFALLLGLIGLSGAGLAFAAQTPATEVATASSPADDSGEVYHLVAGDKLKITVFNVAEINGEYSVSPAGNVPLPLIGDVRAVGGTTQTLSDAIRSKLLQGFVKDPKVTVEVLSFRPFYILGEVARPGELPYKANMTIEQAIAAAGGYTYRAARNKAFLRRAGEAEHVLKFGNNPVYVQPGDTIRIGQRFL